MTLKKNIYSESQDKELFIKHFRNNNLPALKSKYSSNNELSRTLHIDGFQLRINIKIISNINLHNNEYDEDNECIYLIMCDKNLNDECYLNNICSTIWNINRSMNNCILFSDKANSNSNKKSNNNLSNKWNIPLMNIDYNNEQNVNKLINFSIKYYWFSKVNQPSVIF